MRSTSLALLFAACSPVGVGIGGSDHALPLGDGAGDDGTDGTDGGGTDDGGTDGTGGTTDPGGTETVPGGGGDDGGGDSDEIFVQDAVHEIQIVLGDAAWNALLNQPKTYVEGELSFEDQTWVVGVRLKGNTSFDTLTGKPAFKIDVNQYVAGQKFYGMPSFYLQNAYWDPSSMHEFLGYGFFTDRQVPSARAAYAHVTVNDIDYGLYVFLEKENGPFLERFLDDPSGSVYESGSFNWPCDLASGPAENPCTCFEVDREGEGDEFADLQALCNSSRTPGDEWYATMEEKVDMSLFLRGQASEMVVSHYDNYGWNINNWRIAHDPTSDKWIWTPWSVDLAFGWYPWMTGPHCGTYGVYPTDYQQGYLIKRCWKDATCKAELLIALEETADAWEEADMPARVDAAEALIAPFVESDHKRYYSFADFENEVACMRTFSENRAEVIRAWVATQ